MTTLSTHVLDAALGVPAADLEVRLDDEPATVTDADGRVGRVGEVGPGAHVLTFATGAWFGAQGRDTFFPSVQIAFEVDPGQEHYHVALLLSPFAYTIYRGS